MVSAARALMRAASSWAFRSSSGRSGSDMTASWLGGGKSARRSKLHRSELISHQLTQRLPPYLVSRTWYLVLAPPGCYSDPRGTTRMANVEAQVGLLPSIIDRLIDPESAGNAIMIGYDTRTMAEAVRRDLEDLLNTRNSELPYGDRLPEVSTSIVQFGLPDLVSAQALTDDQRRAIGRTIVEVIERYEPRLKDVRVQLLDPQEDFERAVIRFKIDAELNVSPAEPVAFDTVLEVGSGHLAVRAAADE